MDLLIAPREARKLTKVTLPRPKDESPQHFFYDEDNLAIYEVVQYKDNFRSWFVDNQLSTEGQFKMLTKMDPLYILIPQLIKYANNQFRPIADILQDYEQHVNSSKESKSCGFTSKQNSSGEVGHDAFDRLDFVLTPNINWNNVCDTQQIDEDTFVRFSEGRTIDWLLRKHDNIRNSLAIELDPTASRATINSYAIDLLDDYVHHSLSAKFKDSVRKKQYNDPKESTHGMKTISSNRNPETKKEPNQNPSRERNGNKPQPPPANSIARFFTKK